MLHNFFSQISETIHNKTGNMIREQQKLKQIGILLLKPKIKTLSQIRCVKTLPTHTCTVTDKYKPNPSHSQFVLRRDFQENDAQPFGLMEMPHISDSDLTIKRILNNWKTILRILVKYDPDFRPNSFLLGSKKAIFEVSRIISEGNFNALDGLLTAKAIKEVKANINKLPCGGRKLLQVHRNHVVRHFIFDIRLKESPMLNQSWSRNFNEIIPATKAEILVVTEGSFAENPKLSKPEETFFCNYKFEKSFENSGREPSWIITQLNHFVPSPKN